MDYQHYLVTVNVEFIFAVPVFIKIGNTRNNERVVSLFRGNLKIRSFRTVFLMIVVVQ
jgi:hypothetical protein